MLATILKSPEALETTLAIIDTFAKVRELGRAVHQIQSLPENSPNQKTLIEHTGDLIADLMIPENGLEVTGTETIYEFRLCTFGDYSTKFQQGSCMFIKINPSKNYKYVQLVRAYRENGKIKHEVLFNLGRLDQLENNPEFQKVFTKLAKIAGAKSLR